MLEIVNPTSICHLVGDKCSSLDQQIAHVAQRQFGIITTDQLNILGLGRNGVSRRSLRGRLVRIHRGVYVVGAGPLTRNQRCLAGTLAVGDDAGLSHLTAAIVQGFWKRSQLTEIHVTCGRRVSVPGVQVHQSKHWNPASDRAVSDGLPCTSVELMALDLTQELTRYQITNVVKEAAFWGRFSSTIFRREVERLSGRAGVNVARQAVASYEAGCAGTRSALEDRMVKLVQISGVSMPDEAGVPVGPHEVDLIWRDQQLIVEVDGPGHRQPNSRKKDPARDADLRRMGFQVVRFTNLQIDYHPEWVVEQLEQLI